MGKKETEEFLNVFGEIIDDNKVNRFYSDQIRDWVVYNSKIDDRAMLAKLEEKMLHICLCILLCIIQFIDLEQIGNILI